MGSIECMPCAKNVDQLGIGALGVPTLFGAVMDDLAAKVLQLSPEQHGALGHAIALAHAIHASIGGKGIGVAPRYRTRSASLRQ